MTAPTTTARTLPPEAWPVQIPYYEVTFGRGHTLPSWGPTKRVPLRPPAVRGLAVDDSKVAPMFATSEECERDQCQRREESRRIEGILDAHHRRTLEIMTRPPQVILSREGLYVGIF